MMAADDGFGFDPDCGHGWWVPSEALLLGWQPCQSFETGLEHTVRWYLDHLEWVRGVRSGDYQHWIEKNYGAR